MIRAYVPMLLTSLLILLGVQPPLHAAEPLTYTLSLSTRDICIAFSESERLMACVVGTDKGTKLGEEWRRGMNIYRVEETEITKVKRFPFGTRIPLERISKYFAEHNFIKGTVPAYEKGKGYPIKPKDVYIDEQLDTEAKTINVILRKSDGSAIRTLHSIPLGHYTKGYVDTVAYNDVLQVVGVVVTRETERCLKGCGSQAFFVRFSELN